MKRKNVIILVAAVVLLITVFYSFQGSQDDTAYIKEIEKEREERDRFMRTSPESPFAKSEDVYKGLKYYSPDIRYRIIANLLPVQQKKAVTLTTNDGKEQRYIEYAYAEFRLDGVLNKLLILEIADMGSFRGKLFLAFGDETSAMQTYGAGRYLDVTKTPGSSTIKLDFNLAYNPYCAYDNSYSCPLPPRENILSIPIEAGEKSYK
ncbi:MAG: DUF1684 domain-containing protein [Cyclobacteriaceae bacterium]